MEHIHENPDEANYCDDCREVRFIEESLYGEDLIDLRISSLIERYNFAFRSDLTKNNDSGM